MTMIRKPEAVPCCRQHHSSKRRERCFTDGHEPRVERETGCWAMRPPWPARLEAFSDGVIAIILAIMVLELKAQTQPGARHCCTG